MSQNESSVVVTFTEKPNTMYSIAFLPRFLWQTKREHYKCIICRKTGQETTTA